MRFRGLVHRAHNPQWSWTPLSGEGARRHGGRFNRRGLPALYTSLTPLAAIREAQPLGRPMQPLTLCAYEVDAKPVLDTLDEERRRAPGVLDSHLACPAWEAEMLAGGIPASQALADRLPDARPYRTKTHRLRLRFGFDAARLNQLVDELETDERTVREVVLRQ